MLERNSHIYCGAAETFGMPSMGDRIVDLRTALGLSQPELARRIGIKQPSLHNIESGKTKTLRGATLAGLCRVLNVTPEILLQGSRRARSNESVLHEAELLAIWRSLTDADRTHLLAVARALASRPKPPGPGGPSRPATTDHGALTPR